MKTTCSIELSFFRILVAGFMLTGLLSAAQGAEQVVGQFETPKARINYLILLPEGYDADTGRQWPLFFGLHGGDVRGDNVERLGWYETSPPYGYIYPETLRIREQFIRAWPQCPTNTRWSTPEMLEVVETFLDKVLVEYAVDANRIYLFGISLGAEGVWALSMRHLEQFAAIAPIVGRSWRISEVCVLKDVPTWVFQKTHGLVLHRLW